jgi:hypothetical protein
MADFCLWGAAIAEALGFGASAFLTAYGANVKAQTEEVLEADPVARAVRELVATGGEWSGTASELLKLFRDKYADEMKSDGWPKRADGLSRRIRVLNATLAEVGIRVEQGRNAEVRTLTFRRVEQKPEMGQKLEAEQKPGTASSASSRHLGLISAPSNDANDANDVDAGYCSTSREVVL